MCVMYSEVRERSCFTAHIHLLVLDMYIHIFPDIHLLHSLAGGISIKVKLTFFPGTHTYIYIYIQVPHRPNTYACHSASYVSIRF